MSDENGGEIGLWGGITRAIVMIIAVLIILVAVNYLVYPITYLQLITVLVIATIVSGLRMNKQYEESVVLRWGKFLNTKGPGVYMVMPFSDNTFIIDKRIATTVFTAKETLTADNIPVNVDAILFWKVVNVEKAALAVMEYWKAIGRLATCTLRDVIGRTELNNMLSKRQEVSQVIINEIKIQLEKWGVEIDSIEINEVTIPKELQDAISRQAQAERERTARVTLAHLLAVRESLSKKKENEEKKEE